YSGDIAQVGFFSCGGRGRINGPVQPKVGGHLTLHIINGVVDSPPILVGYRNAAAVLTRGSPLIALIPLVLGGIDRVGHGVAIVQPGGKDERFERGTTLEPVATTVSG